jgi:hypothetical protein
LGNFGKFFLIVVVLSVWWAFEDNCRNIKPFVYLAETWSELVKAEFG